MPFYIGLLFVAFLFEQLYALNYHFPHPPSGLVYHGSLQLLKVLSVTATFLAWKPVTTDSPSTPWYTTAVTLTFFLSSLSLFAWTATVARPRQLSVIYGCVTPTGVLSSGPFALVRHPTYVAYALGWVGVVVRAVTVGSIEGVPKPARVAAPLRNVLLACSVLGLFWLYRRGAVLEEEQFLQDHETVKGEKVGEDVRIEYLAYMRRVPYRWIPGVV